MTEIGLPLWVAIPAGLLLIVGGLFALIGSVGLLRMSDFYARMHPPTMGATLGAGCVLLASMLLSSAMLHRAVVHEVLIALFMTISAPVSAMILMQAAVSRTRASDRALQRTEAAQVSRHEEAGPDV